MNIGIVTTWMYRGASIVSKQYEEVLKKTDNIFIYARGGEKYPKNDSFWNKSNVHWSKPPLFQLNGTPIDKEEITSWIIKNNIECVIFNEQQSWEPLIWVKNLGVPIVAYVDYYTSTSIKLYDYYDLLICNTKRHFESFKNTGKALYIPWGTNIPDITNNKKLEITIPERKINLLFNLGHNWYRKGFDQFMSVISKNTTLLNDFHLIVYTQKSIKFLDKKLDSFYNEIKKKNNLTEFKGDYSVGEIYNSGDIYIYLSRLDGIGLSLPEALSFGLPSIIPDNPPMNEFVFENVNGWKVDVKNFFRRKDDYYHDLCEIEPISLLSVLNKIRNQNINLQLIKNKTRKLAEKKLNWNKNSEELSIILKKLDSSSSINVSENDLINYDKLMLNKLSIIEKLSFFKKNILKFI